MQVQDLSAHPQNPRKITDLKLKQLEKTINEFGSLDGIVYNRVTKQLVSGHQRLKHADPKTEVQITEELKDREIDGTVARGFIDIKGKRFPYREVIWDEDMHSAAMLAANMNAGDWDLQRRADIMLDLDKKNKDLELTGHDEKQIKDLVSPYWPEDHKDDPKADEIPETKENEFNVQLGDLWQLGEHRLLCGDCTVKENVDLLMNGEKADMVFTDPPYGINKEGIKNDNLSGDAFNDWNFKWVSVCPIARDASYVAYHSTRTFPSLLSASVLAGWKFEKMFFFYRPDKMPVHTWNSWMMNSQAIMLFSKGNPNYLKVSPAHQDVFRVTSSGLGKDKVDHPTMKPVQHLTEMLSHFESHSVYDPFLGSGSTLIACEKTKRKCYGMEIDPHYCSVIIKRWQEYTGNTAHRLNGE